MNKETKEIEIPFGAKDSELKGWEYTIPEGMEAIIVDNKIVVKKKEPVDERIRKELIDYFKKNNAALSFEGISNECVLAWLDKKGEQKPWSEEDELRMENILSVIEGHGYPIEVEWIKSLKDRVQPQTKQEWSEEDENRLNSCISILENRLNSCISILNTSDGFETLNSKWLKSLRPQNRWKPSEGQMESITCAVRRMKESACYDSELVSLFKDLKKLREE